MADKSLLAFPVCIKQEDENEIGEMSVNVDGNIDLNHFSVSLANAMIYTSEEDEEEDQSGNMRA